MRRCLVASLSIVVVAKPPNLLVMFFDDFGWGDASFNDPQVQETPQLAALSKTSKVFADFHAGASVCTPSRAALLTGRYGVRTGVYQNFGAASLGGIPKGELILPQLLSTTHDAHMFGKWHLGHNVAFQPTVRGFQSYFGLPYSGDMGCLDMTPSSCKPYLDRRTNTPACPGLCPADAASNPTNSPGVPLYYSVSVNCSGRAFEGGCDGDILEQPVNEVTLNRRLTDGIVAFLMQHAQLQASAKPFLLYVGYAHTHTPLAYEPSFANVSLRHGWKKAFGNTLAELDHSVGLIVDALDRTRLRNNTLLVVTADNGPANVPIVDCDFIGSSGPYTGQWQQRNGGECTGTQKGTTWEGGHRVVGLFSWPGHVTPSRTNALASTLDLVPTFLSLAGISPPADREFDGLDLSPVLFSNITDWSAPRILFHPDEDGYFTAGRMGRFKLFTKTAGARPCFNHDEPNMWDAQHTGRKSASNLCSVRSWDDALLAFDLAEDPEESAPVKAPVDVVDAYLQALKEKKASVANTLKHSADWSENGTAAWPCCNRASSSCRCAPTLQFV